MKAKISVVLLLLSVLMLCVNLNSNWVVKAQNMERLAPYEAMIAIEGNTGTVLYSYREHDRLAMASTTKIVTAIVAIENCNDLDAKFRVSDKSIGIEGTSMYLKEGEMLSMRELLYGLILASGNDCAVAIAEYFGSEEEFVGMMNDLVSKLELTNTHFDNPHGLDSDTHYTSAYDLAIITAYALKNPVFKDIVSTKKMVIEPTDVYQARYLKHKNRLLFDSENCIGVKTGFTDNAGRCLVNAHEENGMQIISVVLDCPTMFEECALLNKLSLRNYTMKEFVKPYNFISKVSLQSSNKSEIGVITIEGYSRAILKGEEDKYSVIYDIPKTLKAPIELNEVVGKVKVLYEDEVIFTSDLITIESADNNDLKYLMDNIIAEWF